MRDVDGAKGLRLRKYAVDTFRRSTWGDLRDVVDLWADDLAQEVTIEVLHGMREGRGTGLRWAMKKALNTIFGQAVGHRHRAGDTFVAAKLALPDGREIVTTATVKSREPSAVIALWRLQRMWPGLSDVQRATARRVVEMVDG